MRSSTRSVALLLAFLGSCTDTGEDPTPPGGSSGQLGAGAGGGSGAGGSGTAGSSGSAPSTAESGGSGAGGGSGGDAGTSSAGGSSDGGKGGAAGSGSSAGSPSGGKGGQGAAGSDGGASARAGIAGEAGAGETPELTSFKIAVIGSSTAAGEGASSSSRGWVSLLRTSLEEAVLGDFTAANLAMGGYTSVELLPDSGADGSIDDALESEPNLVVLSLAGSNDLSAGTSTNTFMMRLETIRDAAVNAGVPIFFVSTAPKDLSTSERETLRDWANEMGTRFSTCWVPAGSNQHGPCFIDIFATLANASLGVASEYSAGDGIHLNDAGHAAIHEAALAVIEPYVCSMTPCR